MDKEFEKSLNYTFRLLNLRQRSEKELCDKLKQKGYDAVIIRRLVKYLKELNLIDDEAFARAWVNTKVKLQSLGPVRLRYELRLKGIDENIIETVLEEIKNNCDLQNIAIGLLRRKLKTLKIKDKNKVKQNLYGFLRRKGFSTDEIFAAMEEVMKEKV